MVAGGVERAQAVAIGRIAQFNAEQRPSLSLRARMQPS